MPAKSFTCPKCGKKSSVKEIEANDYACLNPRCALRDRLLVHGEVSMNGRVTKNFGWVLEKGTILNKRYVIEKLLGKGGFGATYLARDQGMFDKLRAIKEIPSVYFDDKEEEFLTFLEHPSIPKLIERFNIDKLHYSVMEYIEGSGLDEIVRKNRKGLPEATVLALAEKISDVLQYIHTQKVIHRDLKPENILVTKDNSIALIDFGIAKNYDVGQGTRRLARAASSFYSSPEQYQAGKGLTDMKSDIYSYGAILYYLLTGREPVDALSRDPKRDIDPLPRQLNPNISAQVEKTIIKALSMQKQDRFSSVTQLNRMLQGQNAVTTGNCLKCGRTLEGITNFCPNCGHSTNKLAQTNIEPFIFRSGDSALSIPLFVDLCYKHWEDAKWHLHRGDFIDWLSQFKEKALVKKARQYKDKNVDLDDALNKFLEVSKFGAPPQLALNQSKIDLRQIPKGDTRQTTIVIVNKGKGLLKGKLKTSARWIQTNMNEFNCNAGERCGITISLDTRRLAAPKIYEEQLIIQSNARNYRLPITLHLEQPPAKTQIVPDKIALQLKPGKTTSTQIQLKNIGSDEAINWRLTSAKDWIHLPTGAFKARSRDIDVEIDAQKLKTGRYSGAIQVSSSSGNHIIPIELTVSESATNGTWRIKNRQQALKDFFQPFFLLLFSGLLIQKWGPFLQPIWGDFWIIGIFAVIGGFIGIRWGGWGVVFGLLLGSVVGFLVPYATFHSYHFVENRIIIPSFALTGLQPNSISAAFCWGTLGGFIGGLYGLVHASIGSRQSWAAFLGYLIGFILLMGVLYFGLMWLFAGMLWS